ncbi:MAG: murein hydrolase activator EnvC family protein [Gemmiger sp.]
MKQQSKAPAAALMAAGLLFCAFFAPAVRADERKDQLSGAADAARQEYEDARQALAYLQGEVSAAQEQISALEEQASGVQGQLQTVYEATRQAQYALSEAVAAQTDAERALAEKQAAYDACFARCKAQMRAMQMLDGGGGIALLAQTTDLYQLLSFGEVLRQMAAGQSAALEELAAQASALEQERQQAASAAAKAQQAEKALLAQQEQLQAVQTQLAEALRQTDATLDAQSAAAQVQEAVTEEARRAYEQAAAALDRYVQAQSEKYTSPALHCSLDFRCPLDGYSAITTRFGEADPWGKGHRGTDFAAPKGTPVYAVADGVVSAAATMVSWGNCIQISHGTDAEGRRFDTLYAHLSGFAVDAGQTVTRGQLIGYVGNTGDVYGANGGYHLHLELKVNGALTDPLSLIPC